MKQTLKTLYIFSILSCLLVLTACTSKPDGIEPVKDFELDRYLGTWYEIRRLDQPFEKGLSQVTAEYTLRDDGGVNVINRGYNAETNEWKTANGKAYFVGDKSEAFLKVAFFGPFFASYIVFDTDYDNYAYVTGPDKTYLWLLSRSPVVNDDVIDRFLNIAEEKGYKTDQLINVQQIVE